MDPWTRRSPVRLADACVGLVAAFLARDDDTPDRLFIIYAEAHYARVMTPMAVMSAKGLWRSHELKQILDVFRDLKDLRRYLSGPMHNDPPEIREARIRGTFDKAMADPDVPSDALRPVKDYLIKKTLDGWTQPPDDRTNGSS
jgi:hypothetical protein